MTEKGQKDQLNNIDEIMSLILTINLPIIT